MSMGTTHRIAKKLAHRAVSLAFDVPFVLKHAKPSSWALDRGAQRHHLRRELIRTLGVVPSVATHASRRWAARLTQEKS